MANTNEQSIGKVTEVTGDAKIIRTDGTEEVITLGTEVHQGDIIETSGDGAVNVGFVDESSFAVSDNARIAMDEFVFDPQSESGSQDFSVVRGVFMYTSGLIGRENPDSVGIDTPVGSIGIRGTIIGGNINPAGQSQITVIEGAILVSNDAGEQLLSSQFDTVFLSGRDVAPSDVQTLDVSTVSHDYGAIKGVSATLFSSFNDQMQEQGPSGGLDAKTIDDAPDDSEDKTDDKGATKIDGDRHVENLHDLNKAMEGKQNWDKVTDHDKKMMFARGLTVDDVTIGEHGTLYDNAKLWGSHTTTQYLKGAYDPIAQIRTALEDHFSRPDGIDGVIPIGQAGAIITRLDISDPLGEQFSVNDFSILAKTGYDGLLEIKQVGSEFYLKLLDNISYENIFGSLYDFKDSGVRLLLNPTVTSQLDIADVQLHDGSSGSITNITVGFGNVDHVVSGTSTADHSIFYNNMGTYQIAGQFNPDANDKQLGGQLNGVASIFGTSNDDYIEITHDVNFQLLKGGAGIDHLYLRGNTGSSTYNFASNASNIGGASWDLSSIEHIIMDGGDATDKLTIDLDNILNLLKTSDAQITLGGKAMNVVFIDTTGSAANINGVNIVDSNGTQTDIDGNNGFQHVAGGVTGDFGEGNTHYELYQHATLGVVAIESNINGAATGGL